MHAYEMKLKIDFDQVMSKLQEICPSFERYFLERNYRDTYFKTNDIGNLVMRMYEDNTGQLMLYDEEYKGALIDREFVMIHLAIPHAKEFHDIFSQANGQIANVSAKRYSYCGYLLANFNVIVENVDHLGDFLTLQALLSDEEIESETSLASMREMFLTTLINLEITLDETVTASYRTMLDEAKQKTITM